jgi:hypothetical protein
MAIDADPRPEVALELVYSEQPMVMVQMLGDVVRSLPLRSARLKEHTQSG